jgi:glycosyltransferase involved in cell wall biosynthesis
MPAVSIILPTYNRCETIERAVRSVLEQSFEDFELIVVDDGSGDSTAEVIRSLRDQRLKALYLGRNLGANAARNRGIEEARAPLLSFLDSDDAYLAHKLQFEQDFFRRRPEIDVLVSGFVTDHERRKGDVVEANPLIEDNAMFLEALFLRSIRKATPGITVRRTKALAVNGFDESLARRQDFDFLVRLATVARLATTHQPLWVKSYPKDAISANHDSFVTSLLDFYERHTQYYDEPTFRRGFALDLARHFQRRMKRRQYACAMREFATLGSKIKWAKTVRLLLAGRSEMALHRQARKFRRIDWKPSS